MIVRRKEEEEKERREEMNVRMTKAQPRSSARPTTPEPRECEGEENGREGEGDRIGGRGERWREIKREREKERKREREKEMESKMTSPVTASTWALCTPKRRPERVVAQNRRTAE
jgi:hypothetical protein